MATVSAAAPGAPEQPGVMDKGLKKGAIGYLSNIVIGVASTAPAYSLAATLGFIVAVKGIGVHAPAVLLVAFIPMLLVASAYKYFNRADPDAGTTFAWIDTRVRSGDRLAERLGDLPGGRDRDGFAGGHRGDLHLQALRLHRTRRIQSGDHRRGRPMDRDHDLDLLPRHRALGAHSVVDHPRAGFAPRDRHLQRVDDELLAEVVGHRPSDDPPGEEVLDVREIQPASHVRM